jgi:hypothetical protein
MGKPYERSKGEDGGYCCEHKEEKDKYFFKVMIGDFRERIVSFFFPTGSMLLTFSCAPAFSSQV